MLQLNLEPEQLLNNIVGTTTSACWPLYHRVQRLRPRATLMASTVANLTPQLFACKCLNVRLQAEPATTAPPDSASDPVYAQVFVGDEGIQVVCYIDFSSTVTLTSPFLPSSSSRHTPKPPLESRHHRHPSLEYRDVPDLRL